MNLTLTIHPTWASVPVALSRLLLALTALEQPRQPGDDGDDLTELLDGLLDDAPAPAAATPPAAPAWDGTPRTGRSLYRWACDHKALPRVNAIGKSLGYPKRVTEWESSQVAAAYAILTAEPTTNGQPR
jgi:hypothetical protein